MLEVLGYEVNFLDVIFWIICKMYFYGLVFEEVVLNLKFDGCFFCGELVIKLNYYINVFYFFF